MGSMLSFFGRQLFITPQSADPRKYSLKGQCGLVTGSNVGLGFEAAKQLLGLGLSKLILAVRNQKRGEAARRKLAAEYPNAKILIWIVDMASYESIKAFVAQCQTLPRLDFAILNALHASSGRLSPEEVLRPEGRFNGEKIEGYLGDLEKEYEVCTA